MKIDPITKTVKYEDQFLTIKNYKEPLRAIPEGKGYGFYGCLMVTIDGKYAQCHLCGKLFQEVASHSRQKHRVPAPEYKKMFMLSSKTALISEQIREERKQRTLTYISSLSKEQKEDYRARALKGMREVKNRHSKESLENKNKKGTCPDQLLAKITEVSNKIGHTPSLSDFITETGGQRFKHLIFATFGSWKNALKMLNLEQKPNKGGGFRPYTNEQLLEYLTIYAQENRSLPTATDCKRGLLPDYQVYQRRFGSFEEARELAGVYQFVERKN